ncbi:MAG: septum formation initiator [Ponticaulis sp.]|nr:septum formation initiator [Ponticaulis sp.]
MKILLAALGCLALTLSGTAIAQGPPPASEIVPTVEGVPEPYRQITRHELKTKNGEIEYAAIAADTHIYDLAGNVTGSIFSFTYLRTDVQDPNRPVLFVFNGGPGAASIWIHMGAIGPRQVVLDADVNPSSVPPFEIRDNPASVLDVADIVFIDPIGTGYSRTLNGTKPNAFWGVDEDANSIAQFMELWLSEYGRWNSPKFVLGESYGTVRAAVLPRALTGGPLYGGVMRGITLDGIIMLGTTIGKMGRAPDFTPEELAATLARQLPGQAVTSRYHGITTGPQSIPELFEETLAYAKGPYLEALLKLQQETLTDAEKADVLAQLSAYTGVPETAYSEDLHLDDGAYVKRVLGASGMELGKYDSRYSLPLAQSGNDPVADDPAMALYTPGFVASFHQMLREDLEVAISRPYLSIRWQDLNFSWNYRRQGPIQGETYAHELAWAMRRNPDLNLMVASGYYDLVTTPAEAKAQVAAAALPEDRVTFKEYESGHMLYLGGTSEAFADDLRAFLLKD